MKQLPLDIAPSPPPTLANFVPGRNIELLQTLSNIIEGLEGSVSFIYGVERDAEKVTCYRQWRGFACGKKWTWPTSLVSQRLILSPVARPIA